MFPYLAAAFFIVLILAIFYGMGIVLHPSRSDRDLGLEKCTLCRKEFEKLALVEREVGDSRLYYFCESCIRSLDEDLNKRNRPERPTTASS